MFFESLDLLAEFDSNTQPKFTIVPIDKYIRQLEENATRTRNSMLPTHFLISLSYRPTTNTVLKLLETTTDTFFSNANPSSPQRQDNSTPPLTFQNNSPNNQSSANQGTENTNVEQEIYASVLMSSTATYLQQNRYLDLWSNISAETRHNVAFVVSNGTISSCLDGVFRPADPLVTLWNSDPSRTPPTLSFSRYLHSVQSAVSFKSGISPLCITII